MAGQQADQRASSVVAEFTEAVHGLQQSVQQNDARLKHMEEAGKVFSDTQAKMDDKIDNMFKMMQLWNATSEFGSAQKCSPYHHSSPTPPNQTYQTLTPDELAFLKKHEATGKITL
jgi:hypothetical protein